MLVSRKWSLSAARFLYRDIVVRRVSSLVTLAETLRQDPCRGAMIQALQLDCLVPTSMNEVARDALCLILDSCSNLRTLGLGRFFISSFLTDDWPHETKFDSASVDATIRAISRRTPTLQKLAFIADFPNSHYFPPISLLTQTPRLVSLTISIPKQLEEGTDALSFPSLKELRIIVTRDFRVRKGANIRSLMNWSLPFLNSLVLSAWYAPNEERASLTKDFWKFLEVHGSNLRFLDFSACYLKVAIPKYNLNRVCPRLEHLVLSRCSPFWPSFQSHTLHLDVWSNPGKAGWNLRGKQSEHKTIRCKAKKVEWGSLRYLSMGLCTAPGLPSILSPRPRSRSIGNVASGTQSQYLHDFFGMRIIELDSGLLLEDEDHPKGLLDYDFLWPNIVSCPNPHSESESDSDSDSESDLDSDSNPDHITDDDAWLWDGQNVAFEAGS